MVGGGDLRKFIVGQADVDSVVVVVVGVGIGKNLSTLRKNSQCAPESSNFGNPPIRRLDG